MKKSIPSVTFEQLLSTPPYTAGKNGFGTYCLRDLIYAYYRQLCGDDEQAMARTKKYTDSLSEIFMMDTQPSPIEISVLPMRLSSGDVDYYVQIKRGDRSLTPYMFRNEEYKAQYEAASLKHVLLGAAKPEILDYNEGGWPVV